MPESDQQTSDIDWWLQARRVVAGTGMAAAAFAGGAAVGTMAVPTQVEIGPHEASAQLTFDNTLQMDLGPLGRITAPSPMHIGPFDVGGVKVTVEQIPNGDGAPLGATEITAYEQFFTQAGRTSDIERAQSALTERALTSGAGALAGGAVLWWLLGARGRETAAEVMKSRRMSLLVAGTMASLLLTSTVPSRDAQGAKESAVLEAAGLHGVEVEGKIMEALVYQYGPDILEYIQETDAYYREIKSNLFTAYEAKRAAERAEPTTLSELVAGGQAEEVVWVSDNHCNTETAAIVAEFANTIKSVLILDSGDQTLGGTRAEKRCVAVMPNATDIPIVVALGNHDDKTTTGGQDRELGYTVLAGKTVEVAGYRILGDADVMRSPIGVPYHQVGPETIEEQGERIAAQAQEDGDVDIVLMHEPTAGVPAAQAGNAKLIATGHTHTVQLPKAIIGENGEVVYAMTNGSTGGAAPNKITFESKLGKDATITVLVFDKLTKDPLGYRIITLHTDKSVEVGDLTPMPEFNN